MPDIVSGIIKSAGAAARAAVFFAAAVIAAAAWPIYPEASPADPGTVLFEEEEDQGVSVEFVDDGDVSRGFAVSFGYGFRNIAKTGRRLPFDAVISNSTGSDTDARLILGLPGSVETSGNIFEDAVIEYSYDVSIPAGGSASVRGTITVAAGRTNPVTLRLEDAGGSILCMGETDIDLKNTEGSELLIGLLSKTPEKLSYFNGISIGGSTLRTRTVELDASSMPDSAEGLEQLDMLIISGFDAGSLGPGILSAVRSWLGSGGVLLMGTGGSTDISGSLPEDLGLTVSDPQSRSVNMGLKYSKSDPDDAVIALEVCEVYVNGGIQVMQSDDIAMLTTVLVSGGTAGITAYDLCDISDFCTEETEYAEDLLRNLLGTSRLIQLGSTASGSTDLVRRAVRLTGTMDPSGLPGMAGYLLFAVIYVVLVSFGSYLLLRRHGMSQLYLIACPIIAFMAAIFIWIMGSGTRSEGVLASQAVIREFGDDSVSDTGFIRLEAPSLSEYTLSFPEGARLHPIVSEQRRRDMLSGLPALENPYGEEAAGSDTCISISYGDRGTSLMVTGSEPFTGILTEYSLEKDAQEDMDSRINASVSCFGGEISGTVTNNTEYLLRDIAVLMYGRILLAGDLEPGASADLGELRAAACPVGSPQAVSAYAAGLNALSADDDEYYTALKYQRLLEYYMDDSISGYFSGARIAAFTDGCAFPEASLQGGKLDFSGCMLLVADVSAETAGDGFVWSEGMEIEPDLISGDYDFLTNTTGGSCVLEYSLGAGLDVVGLGFDEAPDGFEDAGLYAFEGTVSVYNYSSGGYEKIIPGSTLLEGADLRGFLSPANTITVRYTGSSDDASAGRYCLPMLSVTGYEE